MCRRLPHRHAWKTNPFSSNEPIRQPGLPSSLPSARRTVRSRFRRNRRTPGTMRMGALGQLCLYLGTDPGGCLRRNMVRIHRRCDINAGIVLRVFAAASARPLSFRRYGRRMVPGTAAVIFRSCFRGSSHPGRPAARRFGNIRR